MASKQDVEGTNGHLQASGAISEQPSSYSWTWTFAGRVWDSLKYCKFRVKQALMCRTLTSVPNCFVARLTLHLCIMVHGTYFAVLRNAL